MTIYLYKLMSFVVLEFCVRKFPQVTICCVFTKTLLLHTVQNLSSLQPIFRYGFSVHYLATTHMNVIYLGGVSSMLSLSKLYTEHVLLDSSSKRIIRDKRGTHATEAVFGWSVIVFRMEKSYGFLISDQ